MWPTAVLCDTDCRTGNHGRVVVKSWRFAVSLAGRTFILQQAWVQVSRYTLHYYFLPSLQLPEYLNWRYFPSATEGKMGPPKHSVTISWWQSRSCLCSAPQVQAQVIQETVVPKEPPPEFEFIADPPSISAFDLDVVKLTAQFVARNGRQFLTQLMQKEQRNYQFDFLRPQHSLFNYFTKLVEQYTKVLVAVHLWSCFPQQQCWFWRLQMLYKTD